MDIAGYLLRLLQGGLGNLAADVQKIADIKKIMEYNILGTPGLVINGKVKCSGRIPSLDEIKRWIQEEL